jgi:hypothetical protein
MKRSLGASSTSARIWARKVEAYREVGVYRMILIEANPNVFEQLRARFRAESGMIIRRTPKSGR